jgi:hypothetical protein
MRPFTLSSLSFVVTLLLGVLVTPGTAAAQTEAQPTPIEVAYLADTKPFRERLGTYQEQLVAHQQAVAEGQLDSIAMADLSDLTRELFAARQAFAGAVPSARLDQYDRTIKLAIDRGYAATVLLLRAQVTDSLPDRDALIREAAIQSGSSSRLMEAAEEELRALLPAAAL